jgi:hypothetical protein
VEAGVHPAEAAGWRRGTTGTEMRPRGERAVRLLGAGAGWAGGLVAPSHGLGAGRNAGFGAGGFFAGIVLRFLPVEQGFPAFFRFDLCRFLRLGSGGGLVFVMTVKGPVGARGRGNWTERAESECEANNQKESLHSEDLI